MGLVHFGHIGPVCFLSPTSSKSESIKFAEAAAAAGCFAAACLAAARLLAGGLVVEGPIAEEPVAFDAAGVVDFAAGTLTVFWHFGHLPLFPAAASGTVKT